MADPKVKFKRSSVQGKSPAINDLPLGEIALNTYDGIVYVAKSTDSGLTTSIINISGIKIEDDDNLVGYANTINFKGTGVVATIQNGVGIVTVTSGGEGSTPGGVSGNIQFNDNGSFEGSNNLTFNGNDVYVAGVVTATSFSGTATSTTNIPNLTGDVTSNNTATTLATVNSNIGTFGSSTAIPSITVNAKGLVTGVTTNAITVGDGTLTLATSGTGLSGSASFTANQSGNSTFTVTSNATSNNDTSTIVARDSSGNFSAGTITASLNGNASSATYASTAGVATALQNPRTFQITGDIIASPVSFDGSGNVSLAATVQPNSVGLGTDTFGDYVQSLSGTTNQITVTSGIGEGSTPTLSIPNQFTVPQDIEVTRDLQVNRNLNVNGNITIGGTSASLFSQSLNIFDPDIVLGYRTDAFNNDISNDNTANHGGVALASTEGTPLVQLFIAGIETNPATYKKIMWFKTGEFAGLGTDAWLINYAVGIGSTQFPTGTRLAAGSVQFTEDDLTVVRNINASGIITATGGFNLGISSAGTPITSGPLTTLNFVGAGNTFAVNGTTVDISIAGGGGGVEGGESYWSQTSAGIHTLSNVGIGTTNPTSALTVKGNTSLETLSVSGVGTFLSSGLKIRNSANTFQYNITGGAITADRTLNIPVITGTDTLATLGLTQTFTTQQTFQGTLAASGAVTFNTTTSNINLGTGQGTGTFTIGGTSQTGAITLGRATTTQTTNIQAGVTASGNTKTINLGTDGASGSRTLITVGSATAGAASTVTIPSPTNLLIGAATSTGTASQPLQVSGGAYVSGNVGIGTTNPTSKLSVVGDGNFTGVITATGGFNLGISSAGTPITSGPVTTLNFVGAGNTFAINGTTVDISVAGGGGGASVSISTEAPSSPNEGDLWYSSILGRTFIYYVDEDSSQWVDAAPFNPVEPPSTPGKTSGTFTATEEQTLFNYTYKPGFIDVFLNGVRLNSSEFVATNGSSITLMESASVGDVLDIVEYTMGIGSTGPTGSGGPLSTVSTITSNETYYPLIVSGIGSVEPYITTTNDYFEFNPSSGTLTTNQLKIVGVCTATDFNSTSDINLKENVQPINNPLEKITQINGVTFSWKSTKEPSAGVIAQEVEKVFPNIVKDNEKFKNINYNGLIGLLIEGMKEQQKQINTLMNKIQQLEES